MPSKILEKPDNSHKCSSKKLESKNQRRKLQPRTVNYDTECQYS